MIFKRIFVVVASDRIKKTEIKDTSMFTSGICAVEDQGIESMLTVSPAT